MGCKIVPDLSAPVLILGKGTGAIVTTILSHEASMDDKKEPVMIGVARLIPDPDETESLLVFGMIECGVMIIERTQTAKVDTTDTPHATYR